MALTLICERKTRQFMSLKVLITMSPHDLLKPILGPNQRPGIIIDCPVTCSRTINVNKAATLATLFLTLTLLLIGNKTLMVSIITKFSSNAADYI